MVDINVPRFNQACVALLTGVAFVLGWWWLVTVVGVVLALTRFMGPKAGLFTQIYVRWIRPLIAGDIVSEPAGPPRFAQLVGVLFLTGATVAFVAGWTAAGWVMTLIVTALATLAAVTRICVGCIIYEQVVEIS